MAFNPNPPKAEYQATAGQTNFPFLFKIYFTSDIKVYHTPISTGTTVLLTEGIDYSVVINGDDGGTITLILVVENNDYIVLERELSLTRYVEYQTSGDLLAGTLNADQDYQTYLTSDQNSAKDNSLRLPQGTFGVDTIIPSPDADKFFKWNSSGTAVEYGASSSIVVAWGNISGTLSDQADLQNELNLKADTSYVNAQLDLKADKDSTDWIATNNGTWTGSLSGDNIIATGTTQMQDRWVWQAGASNALNLYNSIDLTTKIVVAETAETFTLNNFGALYNGRRLTEVDSYATQEEGGTIRIFVSGTDCYITTDGSTPGP